jgi:ADP-heptose:LPS heptosyltransferase
MEKMTMTKPNLWVKIFAPGIGDLVILGPVLYNIKARNITNKINLIVYNAGQYGLAKRMPWVDGVRTVTEMERLEIPERDFLIDMSEHPLEKIWWGSEEYIGKFGETHVIQIMDRICGGMGIPSELPPLDVHFSHLNKHSRTVFLAVGGRRRTKLLPNDTWLGIEKKIQALGWEVALIGSKGHEGSEQIEELEQAGIPYLPTEHIGEVIDVIEESVGVISIDSGLYHIASYLNKPTVGLFGPMQDWLWGGLGKYTVNLRNFCPINCTSTPLDWSCVGHPCMNDFTSETIVNEFIKVLEGFENGE